MRGKIFNAYTAFVLGAMLLSALTFIELPCPVCHGTGVVKGVTNLDVTGIEAVLVDHVETGIECGWDYERYSYNVKLTVTNKSSSLSYGVVMVTFHDPNETITLPIEIDDESTVMYYQGETLAAEPFVVEVAPNRTQVFQKIVQFEGITLTLFTAPEHVVETTVASEFACPFHGDNAGVPFTDWLKLR